ncbi:hypothetical protein [Fluviispira multicolorata]|uniref:ATP-grasp domain-containing protein n=1 Tax=Fluviispira multicolorata TaxID=2654512 RepID=A0A833JB97_9BACT|nr:hypothetical protein [Fluviispira multicolorata]KAB8028140.1 hypothetical protein GCL57_13915 [Fluviispira multicolorata]
MAIQKKVLIVADSIKKVKVLSDSSLALAQIALENEFAVHWCESHHVNFYSNSIILNKLIAIQSISKNEIKYEEVLGRNFQFSEYQYCFIRKDPPFDEEYKDLCWILASQSKVKVLNPPEALLSYHEKALQWRAFSEGILTENNLIPTCVTMDLNVIENFCSQYFELFENGFICKPWLGHGGESVEFFKDKSSLFDFVNKKYSGEKEKLMIQPFLKEIYTEGDRRVIVAGGEIICDFIRLPPQGKVASNLAQGGSAVLREMTSEQKALCQKIALFLKEKNIYLAGLDVIGNRIGEINITSPTGLRTYEMLTGQNTARKAFQLMTMN